MSFVWPLPMLPGRRPVISHEFEPGKHLGVDLMYRWHQGDPAGPPRTNKRGTYCVPENTPVIAIGDGGEVVYAKQAANGWRTRIRYRPLKPLAVSNVDAARGVVTVSPVVGPLQAWFSWEWVDWLDLHMVELYIKAGQLVTAGQPIGICGGDPTDKPDHLVHDHGEFRRPAQPGELLRDGYGTLPIDPEKFLSTCSVFPLLRP